jgi:hypothetical protein
MPWSAADAGKHMKAAKGQHGKQWAAVANSVLKKTGDEGRAIREANSAVGKTIAAHGRLKKALTRK